MLNERRTGKHTVRALFHFGQWFCVACVFDFPLHLDIQEIEIPFGKGANCHVAIPNNGTMQARSNGSPAATRKTTEFLQYPIQNLARLKVRT